MVELHGSGNEHEVGTLERFDFRSGVHHQVGVASSVGVLQQ